MRPKLTYANVVATLALFLALGGAAYAAATLPKNSVGRAQLKPGAVTSSKVKNGSLTGADVKAGSLPDCPSGMKLAAGACIETKVQGETGYGLALLTCAGEGRRLPTQGELAAYDSLQYSGTEATAFEWVEPSSSNGTAERANLLRAFSGGVELSSAEVNATHAYRCAVGPTY
ncbi:MAG: hypothetical protein U0R71_05165 [Solirubrobacterales bacterium]